MDLQAITSQRTRQISLRKLSRKIGGLGVTFFGIFPLILVGFAMSGVGCSSQKEPEVAEATKEEFAPWNTGRRPKRSPPRRDFGGEVDDRPVVLGSSDAALREAIAESAQDQDGWMILLAGFKGADGRGLAEQALAKAQLIGLENAFMKERDGSWLVCVGSYESGDTEAAKSDLQSVQSIKAGGDAPYAGAMLVPPRVVNVGTLPEFDLRLVRRRQGGERAMYTLQMAQYCRPDNAVPTAQEKKEFEAAAEKACLELRSQGKEAFYYHGARISSVTVGLFTEADYRTTRNASREAEQLVITGPAIESERLRALREEYPYTLVNGQAAKIKTKGQTTGTMIKSQVVEIPK